MTEQQHDHVDHVHGTPRGVRLSVRGAASVTVAPDFGTFHASIRASMVAQAEAVAAVAVAWQELSAEMAALGGRPLAAENARNTLTWLAGSMSSYRDHEFDPKTGRTQEVSLTTTTLDVLITTRDISLVTQLGDVLARHESATLHNVTWGVDDDNPGWVRVRAVAVEAAIAKARHYARALGTTVARIDQLADDGMLAGAAGARGWNAMDAGVALSASGGGPMSPALDPVPQQLRVSVDAQFVTRPVELAEA